MVTIKKNILFFLLFFSITVMAKNCAVTYERNGGFLGDNITSYLSAQQLVIDLKKVQPDAQIDFLHVPFPYSDELMLDNLDEKYNPKKITEYKTVIYYDKNNAHTYLPTEDTLYITTWVNRPKPDYNDETLRNLMKKHVAPKNQLKIIKKPEHYITVACHVRRGGVLAKKEEHMPTRKPLQFVPLHYYKDQIKQLLDLYPEQKLYVHIFTDDKEPEKIVTYFKESIDSDRIMYGYRNKSKAAEKYVLQDFFNMMHFQVMIRPRSNFSKLAQYLGDHELSILPKSYFFVTENKWKINEVQIDYLRRK